MTDYRTRIYENYASEWQNAPKKFDEKSAMRWGKAYDYYLRGWLPKQKNAKIVDLACGGGKLLYYFKQRGYDNISGVDISPEQVKLAQQVTPNVVQENILDFLKSHPDTFDLITGLDIIEHFYKDEAIEFLDLCYQALRNNGRLILQTPNAESPWGGMHRYNDFTHEICFNPNSLIRLLNVCGFSKTTSKEQGPVPYGYSLQSTIRYMTWECIRAGLKIWNISETGSSCSGIFTRVFLTTGCK